MYLTLERNPGALSQFKRHVFPHPLEIRPDFLAPIQMSAENPLTTRRNSDVLVVNAKKSPRFQIKLGWRPETPLTTQEESRVPCLHTRRDLPPSLKWHTQSGTHVKTGEKT